ncbi:MAG: Tail-specific protease [Chlamydiia bacterium]|nr:Tail-specific protease [Chlamydiia bacterium]
MITFSRILTLLLSVTCLLSAAKTPPEITPREARHKIQEILRSHVTHKSFDKEVAMRTLKNFVEELDPLKTYLTYDEVIQYIEPSDELCQKVAMGFKRDDFSQFTESYNIMIRAIERRNRFEDQIDNEVLPTNVQSHEFEEMDWCENENALYTRLLRIRAFQRETSKKLNDTNVNQFLQRVKKQRLSHEETLIGSSTTAQNQMKLSFVIKATASALDSHTVYFTPHEAAQFMIQVQQRLFGIGAQLKDDLNGFSIVRIVEGGPADRAENIKVGDRIIAVNNEPVAGMDITDAVELIRGPQGTPVNLTILREMQEEEELIEEKIDIRIVRDEIVLKESRFDIDTQPFGDGVIAHVHLHAFYQDPNSSSSDDIRDALGTIIKDHKLYGVILDLRNNPGGLLPQAVAVTGLFIKCGVVVSIKDNTQAVQHLRHLSDEPVWDGPLMVLINKASASASEIVAQTLQDYGRAIIVGDEHTFGKGSYQTFTLESNHPNKINRQGEYKVTRGIYYTVSGKTPQLTGALSDIEVPGPFSKMEIGEAYAKYPLQNDVIPANFKDDLTDVHPLYRMKVRKLYMKGQQQVNHQLGQYYPKLRENSAARIEANKNYQAFLIEIEKKDFSDDSLFEVGSNDLQLEESYNVMKDMLQIIPYNKWL